MHANEHVCFDFEIGTCSNLTETVVMLLMIGSRADVRWQALRRLFPRLAALWRLSLAVAALTAVAGEKPPTTKVAKTEPIRLQEVAGEWSDPLWAKDAKALVFIFVSIDCPISNSYAPKLRRISEAFAPKGLVLRLVYPNPDEGEAKIKKHLAEYELPFTAYRDPRHELVRAARVRVTPEAAVYVPEKGWVYHGRIDNRFVKLGKARPASTQEDLQEVLSAALAGTPVKVSSTRAIGCSIPALP
jgi:hypothetical protein